MSFLSMSLDYQQKKTDGSYCLKLFVFKIICIYKKKVSLKETITEVPESFHSIKEKIIKKLQNKEEIVDLFQNPKKVVFLLKKILREIVFYRNFVFKGVFLAVKVEKIEIKVLYGNEEPDVTGFLTGTFYAVKNLLLVYLKRKYKIPYQNIKLGFYPFFQESNFEIDMKVSFSIKLWHLIISFLKSLILRFR